MENRIKLTSSCKDCDILPKHYKAGKIESTDEGKIQYMFNGIKIRFNSYHSPWMNQIIENLKGHHEPQEELCFYHVLSTLSDTAAMIELGSNWSYYSIWFNKTIKNPKNICVEPISDNLESGIQNSKLNNCTNIEFKLGFTGKTYERNLIFKNWDGRTFVMNQYSIDSLLQDNKTFFDIIHSDIQGSEYDMLLGSSGSLNRIGYFVISTHNDKHGKCIKFLKDNNFTILVEHNINESFSGDGLIVAINNIHKQKYEKNIGCNIGEYFSRNCKISKRK